MWKIYVEYAFAICMLIIVGIWSFRVMKRYKSLDNHGKKKIVRQLVMSTIVTFGLLSSILLVLFYK